MTTFVDLIEQCIRDLEGFSEDQESLTTLASSIGPTDLSFTVSDPTQVNRGIVEIEDELVWVTKVDSTTGVCTIAKRGWRGSTAANHASGSVVINNPRFPRAVVRSEINHVIRAMSAAGVYGIGSTEFPVNAAQTTYQLPAGVKDVLRVAWQAVGPSQEWLPVRHWRADLSASTGAFTTGKSITIHDRIIPGRTARVVYSLTPPPLVSDSDDFALTTGLGDSCRDVVIYGTCARVTAFLEPGRISSQAVSADLLDQTIPAGTGVNVGKYFQQLYLMRLQEERQRLQNDYPVTIHYTR